MFWESHPTSLTPIWQLLDANVSSFEVVPLLNFSTETASRGWSVFWVIQGTSCPSSTPRCSTASPVLSILTSCVFGLVRPGAFVSLPRGSGARYYFKLGTEKIVCSRIYMVSSSLSVQSVFFLLLKTFVNVYLTRDVRNSRKWQIISLFVYFWRSAALRLAFLVQEMLWVGCQVS